MDVTGTIVEGKGSHGEGMLMLGGCECFAFQHPPFRSVDVSDFWKNKRNAFETLLKMAFRYYPPRPKQKKEENT